MNILIKILKYLIGIILILLTILSVESYITYSDFYYISMAFSLLLISSMFFPIFNKIYNKNNIGLSKIKKFILGLITIFIPAIVFTFRDETNILELIISIVLTIILWVLTFIISKKDKNNKVFSNIIKK